MKLLFACQYRRMYNDPLLNPLFDGRDPDTNVSALEHGKRLGSLIADRMLGGRRWNMLNRGTDNVFEALHNAHDKAKACPMRPAWQRNRGFTENQRDAWLGHNFAAAVHDLGIKEQAASKLTLHLATLMGFYGPWIKDER